MRQFPRLVVVLLHVMRSRLCRLTSVQPLANIAQSKYKHIHQKYQRNAHSNKFLRQGRNYIRVGI